MNRDDIIAILALKKIKGIGCSAIKNLWIKGFFQNRIYYETIDFCINELKKDVSNAEIEKYVDEAKEIIFNADKVEIGILSISDKKYPEMLLGLNDPPSTLFFKGNLNVLQKVVGIIGTREPDDLGLEISKRLTSYFIEKGYSICNGLAAGIDEACIRTANGVYSNVIGVLAGGLNYNESKTLLKKTALLAEQVLEAGGLLVTEYENSTKEDTFKVIKSCRVQAGLSNGLVIVQSKIGGGSKYTIEAYCALKRPLGVIGVSGKEDDILYGANQSILESGKVGLSKITGLKTDKINVKILPITAKSNYLTFMEAMESNNLLNSSSSNTLF